MTSPAALPLKCASGATRVDVLDEFDPRLNGYRALLLLSIHADSCDYINDEATGFKVAHVFDSKVPDQEDKLVAVHLRPLCRAHRDALSQKQHHARHDSLSWLLRNRARHARRYHRNGIFCASTVRSSLNTLILWRKASWMA